MGILFPLVFIGYSIVFGKLTAPILHNGIHNCYPSLDSLIRNSGGRKHEELDVQTIPMIRL